MSKDQALGALIMIASIVVIIFYAFVDIYFPLIVLQITAFIAIAAVLVILAWIGYTLMTTPAPKPIVEEPAKPAASAESASPAITVVPSEGQPSTTTASAEQPSTTSAATAPVNNTTNQPAGNAAAAPKQRTSRKQKVQQQQDES